MTFLMPISVETDVDFQLTDVDFELEGGVPGNKTEKTKSFSYEEILKNSSSYNNSSIKEDSFDVFKNVMIFLIITIVMAVLSLIFVIYVVFKDKKKMKKIAAIFALLTCIFAFSTAGYFMISWDNSLSKDVFNSMSEQGGSSMSNTTNQFPMQKHENLGFWDAESFNFDSSDFEDNSNQVSESSSGNMNDLFSALGFSVSFQSRPGFAWYLMILVGFLCLFATVILLNKKLLLSIVIFLIILAIITSAIFFYSLKAQPEDTESTMSNDGMWGHESDPAEVAKFVGTWELDVEESVINTTRHNITEETWTFWENSSSNRYSYEINYEYGTGSGSGIWYASDGTLSASYSYSYEFSEGNNRLVLTKDDEKKVFYKVS